MTAQIRRRPPRAAVILAVLAALLFVTVPIVQAAAGDPFAAYGGRAAYVFAQQQRYRQAIAARDVELMGRIEADAVRVGYRLRVFPLTLVDDGGRSVQIGAPPRRIVAFAPSITEILFSIGAGSRVVATDSFSDFPAAAQKLPKLGGTVDANYERLVALDPDLVLTVSGQHVEKMEDLGLTVFVVQPETFEDVFAAIETIGRVTGAVEGAQRTVAAMRRRVAAVRRALAGLPDERRPRVFYEVWYDPIFTVGPGAFIHDVIEEAGGRNVFRDAGTAWPSVGLEAVVARDPEVIITPFPESHEQLSAGKRAGWERVSAVRAGRIMLIDQNLISRPGPRLVDALEQIARYLHPDRVR